MTVKTVPPLPAGNVQGQITLKTSSTNMPVINVTAWANVQQAVMVITDPNYLKMQKRAPIYFAVALVWEQFKSFASQADAERWLRSEKVIGEAVDTREVRAVFSVIGLKYRGPGRPRKSETGCAKSKES